MKQRMNKGAVPVMRSNSILVSIAAIVKMSFQAGCCDCKGCGSQILKPVKSDVGGV